MIKRLARARSVGAVEAQPVVRARDLAVGELGLRDGRAHVDVPQRRRLGAVDVTLLVQAQEAELRRAPRVVADRRVRLRPVDRQAQRRPEVEVRLLELLGDPGALLDEVRPADVDRLLRRLSPAARSRGRRGATGRTRCRA